MNLILSVNEIKNLLKDYQNESSLNNLCLENYEIAKKRGLYPTELSALAFHSLMHAEIAEATESVLSKQSDFFVKNNKPEGETVELIDTVIMIMSYFAHNQWNFEEILKEKMKYNLNRND